MAVAGDVTIAQDGGERNFKSHPYLVALVRWCVSCLWSTATVLLHRLLAGYTIRPSITASRNGVKTRPVGTDHLHPEPKVECQVLHAPEKHSMDIIFVHGLYGSLGNTWRQGDWRDKYKLGLNKVPLLRPTSCTCYNTNKEIYNDKITYNNMEPVNMYEVMDDKLYKDIKKILPNEDMFITEKFFGHAMLDQVEILDNFESQAQFVRDLFESENRVCDGGNDGEYVRGDGEMDGNVNEINCECKVNESRRCEVGCGCVCEDCYSACWPRDWIREDYPEARVISINYTSDPYLWRPLWIKECKRLRLHERADQMTKQLIDLGVGDKPIVWVGHSKGGLFIKQIYCEAYEAHLRIKRDETGTNSDIEEHKVNNSNSENNVNFTNNANCDIRFNDSENNDEFVNDKNGFNDSDDDVTSVKMVGRILSSNNEEDITWLNMQVGLWTHSVGFMFYSVPHRGSPLAGIKTPLTARSIELLEINKDCSLVLSLQDRWLKATESSRPQVRSLVETCRTLMSVLWLRIVSEPSADAGIGSLYGVSVDHREICKPSSRQCLLYEELMGLIRAALNLCKCDS